ncbi:MAG: LuxR C-terminal-related transcriptional regulator, partial [Sedimenticola sp.]|nr:LuxR C-terminal-related transcriptional regulator [Sedimenticola sp.]MCW8881135.1 LuxR C-terminal-related transcriptional regulator [Sedimenticola sp.]MCW8921232.1 LuxR C-terminal-related transcriptional regulator [Sedimenticola sp.]
KTEFFNDYVMPQGLTVQNAIRITLQESDSLHTSIALHYANDKQDHNPENALAICRLMLPHIQTALQLHTKIGQMKSRLDHLIGVLDTISEGVILLDKSGHIIEVNATARHIIEAQDGLQISQNTLQTMLARESNALTALTHEVAKTALGKAITPGRSFHVLRPSGKRPIELLITPVYEQLDIQQTHDSIVAIFIHDPEHTSKSLGDSIQQRYRLTKTETNITLYLIQGRETKEITELLDIQRETLKTHLKNIFKKTNTHRQSELISVILRANALLNCHR